MAPNFIEALYGLKRKAQLTGNPLTNQNINALTTGYLTSATEAMNAQRAVDLQEDALAQTAKDNAAALAEAKREAADRSQQSALESATQVKAADEASKNVLTGNLTSTGTSLVGGYLVSHPETVTDALVGIRDIFRSPTTIDNGVIHTLSSETAGNTLGTLTAPTTKAASGALTDAAAGQLTDKAVEGTAAAADAAGTGFAGSGVLTGLGYAAAAYAGRELLSDFLKSKGSKVAQVQGELMEQPTFEGLTGRLTAKVGEMFGHEEEPWEKSVRQVLDPVGTTINWLTDQCIIVTACTDRHSPDVEIAREYRDRFMSPEQLRGYYMIAETVMPCVVRHRAFVKKHLVDRLVEYGSYHLGKTEKVPCRASCAVTRGFLFLCRLVGNRRESFIRCNGEVC